MRFKINKNTDGYLAHDHFKLVRSTHQIGWVQWYPLVIRWLKPTGPNNHKALGIHLTLNVPDIGSDKETVFYVPLLRIVRNS